MHRYGSMSDHPVKIQEFGRVARSDKSSWFSPPQMFKQEIFAAMLSLCIGTQSRAIRKVEIFRASHGSFLLCAFYKCTFLKFMIICTVNLEVLGCRMDAPRPLPPVYGNNYNLKYP